MTPEEIVEEMRAMDRQIIDGKKPTIFKETADLIEDLRKPKPKIVPGQLITTEARPGGRKA